MTANHRIAHIDYAKAIGIILIIISHIGVSKEFGNTDAFRVWDGILNSFYVPLFFVLSGVFEPSLPGWDKTFLRLLRLIKYIIVFYLFGILSAGMIKGDWGGAVTRQTVIWFLFTLTWITVIMGLIKGMKYNFIVVLFLAILGCILSSKARSLLYLGQALFCLPFYAFGFYFKDFLKSEQFVWWRALSFFAGWLLLFVLFYSEQNISINYVTQNYLIVYVTALLGSLFVIEMCKLIRCELLSYYGRNSIVPMMVQFAFIWEISKFWQIETIWDYIFCSVVVCGLCGLSIPLFRNAKYDVFC